MLLIQNIRQEKEAIIQRLAKRGVDFSELINQALELDDSRKEIQGKLDDVLSQSNKISKSIGQLFAQKKIEEANEMKAKTAELKEQSATLGEALKKAENELQEVLYQIPNSPGNPVPEGKNEEHNKTVKIIGEKL